MSLLEVNHLTTQFTTEQGQVQAVRDVSFSLEKGEILGIVGESGSGKSQAMYSVMGLLASNGRVTEGSIRFNGTEIAPQHFAGGMKEYEAHMRKIRGNEISMIFQDPMSFLNPVLNIETQLVEPLLNHQHLSRQEARQKAIELLTKVGIPSPEARLKQYPHEFSGGMRQRIIIAIALACNPKLIIADEPTTALDVTIQAKILQLIKSLQEQMDSSVILITHDLGVVANICHRVIILYGGKIMESGTIDEIFYDPRHPYTIGLLGCVNNPEKDQELHPIPGSPPDLLQPPAGCPFVDRCEKAMKICKRMPPPVSTLSPTHSCSCWLEAKKEVLK
ncbi:ABC transporter ATP-binding protein [Merdimmobilis hominis]|jgi:oligopeptide transport system ATP-binding protein|uniref:Oligopeptide transport ATP-binding protein OppD n=1 Tax=uncultured Anaerotruncus sp. TaxID=905011 RepID=A0A6N2ULT0_9FIRM|nr:ABC transporter ATP-binding protein [Merdimmobilis hominis]MCD4835288.1 ABC transporter ATP-binding protein [Merdimmobilis hominis]PWL62822.1 MAG: ABC transporter ATP-binding protein [Oscillospiraceae bacterium]